MTGLGCGLKFQVTVTTVGRRFQATSVRPRGPPRVTCRRPATARAPGATGTGSRGHAATGAAHMEGSTQKPEGGTYGDAKPH